MRVIKPLCLSLLSRPFEFQRQFHLGVSVMAFMPISDIPALLAETAMWAFLGEVMPDTPIEASIPKRTAEFAAMGQAYAPGGQPVTSLRVGVQLGDIIKTLNVTGDRFWDGKRASEPKPFTTMPLDWKHTYGGKGFAENPLGLGADAINATPEHLVPLPNVVEAKRPDGDYRHPASFGAVDQQWPQRMKYAGTYGDDWLKNHFPGFPPDMDWRFFNVAPSDQQFSKPLTGTESYAFENLHPEQKLIMGKLPGLTPRLFVTRKGVGGIEEIALSLTTVWFFPDQLRMILIHHGAARVAEEDASDVEHIIIGADKAGALRAPAEYRAVMDMRLDKTNPAAGLHALNDALLVPGDWVVPDPVIAERKKLLTPEGLMQSRIRPRMEREHAKMRAEIAARGLDPDIHIAPLPPEEPLTPPEEIPALIEKYKALGEAKQAELQAGLAKAKAEFDALGVDTSKMPGQADMNPKGPPPFSAAKLHDDLQAARTSLHEMGAKPDHLDKQLADPQTLPNWTKAEQDIRMGYLMIAHSQDPADPVTATRNAELRTLIQQDPEKARMLYDFHGVDFSGMNFSGLDLAGICFDGANLAGCDFSQAKLAKSVLAHANLQGCNFDKADLSEANLGRSNLTAASLRGARLTKSVLTGANLTNARLVGAVLDGATMGDIQLAGARFDHAQAGKIVVMKTSWQDFHGPGINLIKATFIEVDLSGADFSYAIMSRCSFIHCKLDGANFSGTDLSKASFVSGCSLTAVQFSLANLSGANFRETDLAGSDFTRAVMEKTDFSGANLAQALLPRVRASGARFVATNLTGAQLTHGNFMRADLNRADLRGASIIDGGFLEANMPRVKLDEDTKRTGMQTTRMRYLPLYRAP